MRLPGPHRTAAVTLAVVAITATACDGDTPKTASTPTSSPPPSTAAGQLRVVEKGFTSTHIGRTAVVDYGVIFENSGPNVLTGANVRVSPVNSAGALQTTDGRPFNHGLTLLPGQRLGIGKRMLVKGTRPDVTDVRVDLSGARWRRPEPGEGKLSVSGTKTTRFDDEDGSEGLRTTFTIESTYTQPVTFDVSQIVRSAKGKIVGGAFEQARFETPPGAEVQATALPGRTTHKIKVSDDAMPPIGPGGTTEVYAWTNDQT